MNMKQKSTVHKDFPEECKVQGAYHPMEGSNVAGVVMYYSPATPDEELSQATGYFYIKFNIPNMEKFIGAKMPMGVSSDYKVALMIRLEHSNVEDTVGTYACYGVYLARPRSEKMVEPIELCRNIEMFPWVVESRIKEIGNAATRSGT